MEKKSKFHYEIEEFKQAFDGMKGKKIVLYGTGRMTATLLNNLTEFNIIGLCDRDSTLAGSFMYGKKILKKEEAEEQADILIINTADTYWNTIYKRICGWNIPIYYRNGRLACLQNDEKLSDNPYWDMDYFALKNRLKSYEIISFDMFDTLVARMVYSPIDVFRLIEKRLQKEWRRDLDYVSVRKAAAAGLDCPAIDEIYMKIQELTGWSVEDCQQAKKYELEIDKALIIGRGDVIKLYQEIALQRETYIISDMYYPKWFLQEILAQAGLNIPMENIIVSCEKRKTKEDGKLWEWYKEEVVVNKTAAHVGDNEWSDLKMPERCGIKSYYVMSPADMLRHSSIGKAEPHIMSLQSAIAMGIMTAKVFNSPFYLNQTKGKLYFGKESDVGFCIFGNIVYNFIFWLKKRAKEDGIEQIIFFARDGYLLEQAYEYINELIHEKRVESVYLEISRRAIWGASVKSKDDLREILEFPYDGNLGDFLRERLGTDVQEENLEEISVSEVQLTKDRLYDIIRPFEDKILSRLAKERKNYLEYLGQKGLKEKLAVVDTMLYGSTQYYFEKVIKRKVKGYYFCACLDESNQYLPDNDMEGCFQREDDLEGKDNSLWKNYNFIEAFFTAPNGMMIRAEKDGTIKYSEPMLNQKNFDIRMNMQKGVLEFITEMVRILKIAGLEEFPVDRNFADEMFGALMDEGFMPSEHMKNGFYYDNAFMHHKEVPIWE